MNEWSHELRSEFHSYQKEFNGHYLKISSFFFLLRTSIWEEKKIYFNKTRAEFGIWVWYMDGWMERFHLIAWSFILSIRFGNRFMSTNCNEESYSLASFAWNSGWCVSACGCVSNRLDVCMELTKCALKCVHMYTNPWSRCHFSL